MPSVLVTGASRGIGRAAALRFAAAGYDVFAGVRNPADAEVLAATGRGSVTPLTLDITAPEHLAALPGALPPTLDAVVNNAGVIVGGPVEALDLGELRRQLEVNVVGQVAVTQAVLPLLRRSRGRVVFVSSVSGRIATPMTGAYNASKFALEGLADALRLEVAPWGIRVVVVQPVQTDTDMWRRAGDQLEDGVATLSPEHRALYAGHIEGLRRSIPRSQRMAVPADNVARTILRAVTARRPRPRYVVGAAARAQVAFAQITPTPVLDTVLRKQSGVPADLT